MAYREYDKFVWKFRQLWAAGAAADLNVTTKDGHAKIQERGGSCGWVQVCRRADDPQHVQRKARKEVATKYPNMVKFYGRGDTGVDFIMKYLEEPGDYL